MKKLILIGLSMATFTAFAQLKVTNDGKVAIGTTASPVSNLTMGTAGEQNIRSVFESDRVTMRIHSLGNSPYNIGYWGTGLQVYTDLSSNRGDIGIEANTGAANATNRGRAIGITGSAGNATNGYNYGVIGNLYGNADGTGILGTVNGVYGVYVDGRYAGYFSGDVKVTGTISGVVVGSSDIRYKQNVRELTAKEDRALDKIVKLNPISYNYKQIYNETAGSSDTASVARAVKAGVFDEKSQMFRKKHFGLVAQDLQQIYPDLVYEDGRGYLAVNYIELIPLLVQSIKELKAEVEKANGGAATRSGTATSSDMVAQTGRAALFQNAPNPFNDKTIIKFSLPESFSTAFIYVFNLQGALVKQYPIGKRQDSVTIYGSELQAGMYLYSLILDGEEIDTKRMILTR